MVKTKVVNICDKIILFSLYALAFFLPISKALIEIFTYLAIACYLLKKVIKGDDLPKTKLTFCIFAYLIICFASILYSSNFNISVRSFLGKVLQDVFLFFVVVDTLNTKERIKNVLYILFVSSFIIGIDGIYQHFTHKDFIRHRPYYDIPRIHATFSAAGGYGCYLAVVISLIIPCLFNKFNFKRNARFLLLALCILLVVNLLLTLSRGAWLACVISLLFMGIWIPSLGTLLLILGILAFATHQIYLPYFRKRLESFSSLLDFHSIGIDREYIWQAAFKMISYKPLLGLGLGTFMFNFRKFVIPTYIHGAPYAHNCYLQIASELGIVGLIAFLCILIIFFSHSILTLLKTKNKDASWYLLLGFVAAILGYSAQMSVDTIFYSLDLGILFWLVLGMGVSAMKNMEAQ